jgi:hypothetical protein
MNFKQSFLLILACLLATISMAQIPYGFNHQMILRDPDGNILANTVVNSVTFKIRIGSALGTVLYSETHSNHQTNELGLLNLVIGEGSPLTGNFSTINWVSTQDYFLEVGMNLNGNTINLGTQQLQSVPFALHSQTSAYSTDMTLQDLNGINFDNLVDGSALVWDGNNEEWNLQPIDGVWNTDGTNAWRLNGNLGIGISAPGSGLHLHNKGGLKLSKTFTGTTLLDGFYLGQDSFNNGHVYFTNYENADLVFNTNLGERLRITGSGNIGIGWAAPVAPLHLGNSNSGGEMFAKWSVAATGHNAGDGSQIGLNAGGQLVLDQKENLDILLKRNGSTKATIVSTGVDVNGTLSATNVDAGTITSTGATITSIDAGITDTQNLYIGSAAGTGNRPLYVNSSGQAYAVPNSTVHFMNYPGAGFHADKDGWYGNTTRKWVTTSDGNEAYCTVQLPENAVITELKVQLTDTDVTGNMTVDLIRVNNWDTGSHTVMATCSSTGSSGAMTVTDNTIQSASINYETYSYVLVAYFSPGQDPAPLGQWPGVGNVRVAYTLQ